MNDYRNRYVELWQEECVLCLENKDFFFNNMCRCRGLVCQDCIVKCKAKDIYNGKLYIRCPFCRFETPMWKIYYWRYSTERRTAQQAKKNWNFWFNKLGYRDIVKKYIAGEIFNNDVIHMMLRTGRFDDPNGAGVCCDKLYAKTYVTNQMITFVSERCKGESG